MSGTDRPTPFCTHWHGLVSEKVDLFEGVVAHNAQAIPLVPAVWEHIKAYLAPWKKKGFEKAGTEQWKTDFFLPLLLCSVLFLN